jgi:L-ascorbate metabolism protein UlaG (beta-lactamase superfamily)
MSRLKLTFIGHSTVLIDMDGVRVMTDPILRRFLGPLIRFGPPIADEWLDGIDAVLISHLHHDHLDYGSLKKLGTGTPLVVPRGAAATLSRRGHRDITEVVVGDTIEVGDLTVEVVPAVHPGARPPLGPVAEAVGFIVRGSRSVYYPGDTEVFPGMASLAHDLDLALLPVWGWGPTLGKGHMDPKDAAEAAALLRPRVAVPIHWGTFSPVGFRRLKPRYLTEPPIEFSRRVAESAPDTDVQILVAGETLRIDDEKASITRLQE